MKHFIGMASLFFGFWTLLNFNTSCQCYEKFLINLSFISFNFNLICNYTFPVQNEAASNMKDDEKS